MTEMRVTVVDLGDEQPIDMNVIEELGELADDEDPDFVAELVDGYIENANQNLELLMQATKEMEAEQVSRVAHTLKGASHNMGVVRVAKLSAALETLALEGKIGQAGKLLQQLNQELRLAQEEFEKM